MRNSGRRAATVDRSSSSACCDLESSVAYVTLVSLRHRTSHGALQIFEPARLMQTW